MVRAASEDNSRMSLRIHSEDKALLIRAAAIEQTDLTEFVLRHVLRAARQVIDQAERVQLSERDTLLALELLESPPAPNAKLRAAAQGLPHPATTS
ncbi:MAG: DUF1778 domain-containing protein [Acidobacteria bacterium]|nr:DUF1778 domain-containing protein [Acidobacteriota bacterium]